MSQYSPSRPRLVLAERGGQGPRRPAQSQRLDPCGPVAIEAPEENFHIYDIEGNPTGFNDIGAVNLLRTGRQLGKQYGVKEVRIVGGERAEDRMIQISERTHEYSALRLIKAIRRATGIGLKEANGMVADLNRGETISITPSGDVSDDEVSQWLTDCGVVFEVTRNT